MARNLRTKIPTDDLLYIHDINAEATKKFVDEMAGYAVRIAGSARELAEKSVCLTQRRPTSSDENPFSFTE
jgi:3-hydroxyisobutyrate dehydrogenase